MKKLLASVLVIISVLMIASCSSDEMSVGDEILKFTVGNEEYTMKNGDLLHMEHWNDLEVYFNGGALSEIPEIFGDVTLGTDYKKVLEVFGIKKDYAYVDMEVDYSDDGSTDIVKKVYENEDIFDEPYLDIILTVGYVKEGDKWVLKKYDELVKIGEEGNGQMLIFAIDICGMSGEEVDKGEVISIDVYLK